MKELTIIRELNEDTRKQDIWMRIDDKTMLFTLHITGNDEVIVTDNRDFTKIYSVQSLDFYIMLSKQDE